MKTQSLLETLGSTEAPNNEASLNKRLEEIAHHLGVPVRRLKTLVGALVLSQVLPDHLYIKGGSGIKFRLGEAGTRSTSDLDVAARLDSFEGIAQELTQTEKYWGLVPPSKRTLKKAQQLGLEAHPSNAFKVSIQETKQRPLEGVPAGYQMKPFRAKLLYLDRDFTSIDLEIGRDEMGITQADPITTGLSPQLENIMLALGLGPLKKVPFILLEQQIAQKMHALLGSQHDRGHDLVDLQILVSGLGSLLDYKKLKDICSRTFSYRQGLSWPPSTDKLLTDRMVEQYRQAYGEATQQADQADFPLELVETATEAKIWLEKLIQDIEKSQ